MDYGSFEWSVSEAFEGVIGIADAFIGFEVVELFRVVLLSLFSG